MVWCGKRSNLRTRPRPQSSQPALSPPSPLSLSKGGNRPKAVASSDPHYCHHWSLLLQYEYSYSAAGYPEKRKTQCLETCIRVRGRIKSGDGFRGQPRQPKRLVRVGQAAHPSIFAGYSRHPPPQEGPHDGICERVVGTGLWVVAVPTNIVAKGFGQSRGAVSFRLSAPGQDWQSALLRCCVTLTRPNYS